MQSFLLAGNLQTKGPARKYIDFLRCHAVYSAELILREAAVNVLLTDL